MNDEWRLQVDFGEAKHAHSLTARIAAGEIKHDLSVAFGDRAIVSRDGPTVFVYAARREQIERARTAVLADAHRHGWDATAVLLRWHPIAEKWEDPDKSLPSDDRAKRSERHLLMAHEREQTATRGYPEYEVRVEFRAHRDAVALAGHLQDQGLQVVRRWRFLVIGVTDEDSGKELADRIRGESPMGTLVKVEGTITAIKQQGRNPFVVMQPPHREAMRG